MRFYFPDSQDQIDPSFNFRTEERSPFRIRQRDDLYVHEVLTPVPYAGMLVSKAMVDGVDGASGRYSAQQRQRLYRVGIREFFRLDDAPGPRISTLGDCGAFTYVREESPPYSVDEVIDFYDECGFDAGLSLDHVILGFELNPPLSSAMLPPEWVRRQALTLELAEEFLARHGERAARFDPVGVAQGWSPASYAASVAALQNLGYERIALGGLVAQKTAEIVAVLAEVATVRKTDTALHLLSASRAPSRSRPLPPSASRASTVRRRSAKPSRTNATTTTTTSAHGLRYEYLRWRAIQSCSGAFRPARSMARGRASSNSTHCGPFRPSTAARRGSTMPSRRCASSKYYTMASATAVASTARF